MQGDTGILFITFVTCKAWTVIAVSDMAVLDTNCGNLLMGSLHSMALGALVRKQQTGMQAVRTPRKTVEYPVENMHYAVVQTLVVHKSRHLKKQHMCSNGYRHRVNMTQHILPGNSMVGKQHDWEQHEWTQHDWKQHHWKQHHWNSITGNSTTGNSMTETA